MLQVFDDLAQTLGVFGVRGIMSGCYELNGGTYIWSRIDPDILGHRSAACKPTLV